MAIGSLCGCRSGGLPVDWLWVWTEREGKGAGLGAVGSVGALEGGLDGEELLRGGGCRFRLVPVRASEVSCERGGGWRLWEIVTPASVSW